MVRHKDERTFGIMAQVGVGQIKFPEYPLPAQSAGRGDDHDGHAASSPQSGGSSSSMWPSRDAMLEFHDELELQAELESLYGDPKALIEHHSEQRPDRASASLDVGFVVSAAAATPESPSQDERDQTTLLQPCKYGARCYRTENVSHCAEFSHHSSSTGNPEEEHHEQQARNGAIINDVVGGGGGGGSGSGGGGGGGGGHQETAASSYVPVSGRPAPSQPMSSSSQKQPWLFDVVGSVAGHAMPQYSARWVATKIESLVTTAYEDLKMWEEAVARLRALLAQECTPLKRGTPITLFPPLFERERGAAGC